MRPQTIRALTNVTHTDFFGIHDITSKDIAGAFASLKRLTHPILEHKYDPLIKARNRLLNEEKDDDLIFGRVRKDTDNITKSHGQYDEDRTERYYDTVELKQKFVPAQSTFNSNYVDSSVPEHEIDTSTIPNYNPAYRISEVKPVIEISEVLKLFSLPEDDLKIALSYRNKPPLTFYFGGNKSNHDELLEELLNKTPNDTLKTANNHTHKKEKSKEQTQGIKRPQIDLDALAGPDGARAPLNEIPRLSLEYAQRVGESVIDEVKFDRSIEKRIDVQNDEHQRAKPVKAIDYLKQVRKQQVNPSATVLKQKLETSRRPYPLESSIKLDSRGFRNYEHQVPDWNLVPRSDVIDYMKKSIIYHNYDILAVNKPYGISSHANPKNNDKYVMDDIVAEVAKMMRISRVYLAHRLDKGTTGVLLFSTSQERANDLNKRFRAGEIKKTYICITKGVPDPRQGVIDLPLGEIEVVGKMRSCPVPVDVDEGRQLARRYKEARRAITEYQVLKAKEQVSLVELKPQTGIKHQLRCHMGFALNTPILGDHKYSHLTKLAPQVLAPSVLKALHLRQAKVRTLPMHLHAKSIVIPGAKANGETLFIEAPLPQHFKDNMKALKLSSEKIC